MNGEERIAEIPETVLAIAKNPAAARAKAKAEKARRIALAKQEE